jgi:hypothetical protein
MKVNFNCYLCYLGKESTAPLLDEWADLLQVGAVANILEVGAVLHVRNEWTVPLANEGRASNF